MFINSTQVALQKAPPLLHQGLLWNPSKYHDLIRLRTMLILHLQEKLPCALMKAMPQSLGLMQDASTRHGLRDSVKAIRSINS